MNEEKFRQVFVAPMIECYGQSRLPPVKIKFFWDRLNKFPEHVVRQCCDRIILNHETFPGVTNALQTCAEIIRDYSTKAAAEKQAAKECLSCGNTGARVVNNFAYRCNCDLGAMLYPAFPEYVGQVQFKTIVRDENGIRIYEDGNYIASSPVGNKDLRQVRFIVKE